MSALKDFDLFGNAIFQRVDCGGCGITYGMILSYYNKRLEDHKGFSCPNGCSRFFSGESETEKLKRELVKERDTTRRLAFEKDELEKRNRGTRAWLTRTTNEKTRLEERIKNGVCPCCKRSFQNLRRHMTSKHGTKNESSKRK